MQKNMTWDYNEEAFVFVVVKKIFLMKLRLKKMSSNHARGTLIITSLQIKSSSRKLNAHKQRTSKMCDAIWLSSNFIKFEFYQVRIIIEYKF